MLLVVDARRVDGDEFREEPRRHAPSHGSSVRRGIRVCKRERLELSRTASVASQRRAFLLVLSSLKNYSLGDSPQAAALDSISPLP